MSSKGIPQPSLNLSNSSSVFLTRLGRIVRLDFLLVFDTTRLIPHLALQSRDLLRELGDPLRVLGVPDARHHHRLGHPRLEVRVLPLRLAHLQRGNSSYPSPDARIDSISDFLLTTVLLVSTPLVMSY